MYNFVILLLLTSFIQSSLFNFHHVFVLKIVKGKLHICVIVRENYRQTIQSPPVK